MNSPDQSGRRALDAQATDQINAVVQRHFALMFEEVAAVLSDYAMPEEPPAFEQLAAATGDGDPEAYAFATLLSCYAAEQDWLLATVDDAAGWFESFCSTEYPALLSAAEKIRAQTQG
jgi:hypothetical protein